MAEYHVGCGAFAIYAGTLNKSKTMWVNKTDCTDEALAAVAQYLFLRGSITLESKGKRYKLCVVKDGGQNDV